MNKLFETINNYLNGSVNLRFLRHPAVRWGLAGLLVLYVGLGGLVSWKIFKQYAESTNIRRVLAVYPLPAVLMPQDVILVRDYLNQLKFIRHFADKTKKPLPPDNELRSQLVNQLIETRLLLHQTKKYHTRVTRADIEATYKKIADANGGSKEVNKVLTDLYGMTEAEFRLLIRDQLLREKVQKEILAQTRAKHIVIKDEALAKTVLEQAKKEPAKFDELAKQNSEDKVTREKGGDLGFFTRGIMAKAFEEAAFKGKKGQVVADLVKTESGFHIIMVTDRKGKVDQTYQDFINSLRKKTKVWTLLK